MRCGVTLLVYGDRARNRAELDASLKQLDENTERLIRSLLAMDGAEASREDAEALHCLYERSLAGEADQTPSGREVMEVASSLVARLQTLMSAFNDPRAAVIGCRVASVPFPFRLPFALACEAFRTRFLITGRFRPIVVCLLGFAIFLRVFGFSRLCGWMFLRPFAEDHLL